MRVLLGDGEVGLPGIPEVLRFLYLLARRFFGKGRDESHGCGYDSCGWRSVYVRRKQMIRSDALRPQLNVDCIGLLKHNVPDASVR